MPLNQIVNRMRTFRKRLLSIYYRIQSKGVSRIDCSVQAFCSPTFKIFRLDMSDSSEFTSQIKQVSLGNSCPNDVQGDPYRAYIYGDTEQGTRWRHGAPPRYDTVNKLFEDYRTQAWQSGSLEETVQNLVKSWEMELSHKTHVEDFKTINHQNFKFSVNGGPVLSAKEALELGSYNVLLKTTLPQEHDCYKASMETFASSHDIFRTVFPCGFAWEVLQVYSGPPVVSFKWRHWGIMEGAFKGHAPTGEVVESVGVCTAKVDDDLKIMDLEVYYDPTQILGALTKGHRSEEYKHYMRGVEGCPLSRKSYAKT